MNFEDLKSAIRHLQQTCKCSTCNYKYLQKDIHIIATNEAEGLFTLKCSKCNINTVVSLVNTYKKTKAKFIQHVQNRTHNAISDNDILDLKNFLNSFDGNFKKIFNTPKQ